jgi:hypothetical protein
MKTKEFPVSGFQFPVSRKIISKTLLPYPSPFLVRGCFQQLRWESGAKFFDFIHHRMVMDEIKGLALSSSAVSRLPMLIKSHDFRYRR